MKYIKILVLVVFFGTTFSLSYSQYHPLTKSRLFFDIAEASNNTLCQYDRAGRYFIKHDTLIKGNIYTKLYYFNFKTINGPDFCPPYHIDPAIFLSNYFIREDTSSQKVFIFNPIIQKDDLLYDFKLIKGDTLKSEYHKQQDYLKVDSVYNFTLRDSSIRKVIVLNNLNFYIEGIGGNMGIYQPLSILPGTWSEIFCVRDGLKSIYGNMCNSTFVNQKTIVKKGIKVFPNPGEDFINIQSDIPLTSYSIIGSSGNIIENKHLDERAIIDIENLASGLYILHLQDENGILYQKKILKR